MNVSSTVGLKTPLSEALNRPAVCGMMDDLMFTLQKDTSEHEALWSLRSDILRPCSTTAATRKNTSYILIFTFALKFYATIKSSGIFP